MATKKNKIDSLVINPEDKALLDFIASGESGGNYNIMAGGAVKDLTSMPIKDVIALQKSSGKNQKAVGKFQIIPSTLEGLVKKLGLSGDEIFDEELQDRLGLALLNERGYQDFKSGKIDENTFMKNLSKEWRALPDPDTGKTYADSGASANKANKSVEEFRNVVKQVPTKARGEEIKKQNERNYSYEEIADISQRYNRELQDIYAKEGQGLLNPMQVNKAIQDLNQKFYDAGEAGAINQQRKENDNFIKGQQEEYLKKEKEIKDIRRKNYADEIEKEGKKRGKRFTSSEITEYIKKNNKEADRLQLELNNTLGQYKPEYNKDGTIKEVKPDLLNLDNYQSKYIPASDSSETSSSTTGSSTQPDTTYSDLVERYKGPSQAPNQTAEEDPNDFLQAFEYTAPAETMTFDGKSSWIDYVTIAGSAALNLATGIAGMRTANEEAPERDEDISEALLNYAAEQKKISQMGLDPAVEADLKMKLNSVYQFGMENLVRASAGNRNLVLGNQGQLDQAKMQGAMQIALMDVERRDRAMQAYGQVLEYINEFDSRKDIANNERKYREFEKRQGAGMVLAEKGFSNLISDLEHQWENRKGGPNDLMRRKLLSSIMGYDPYAKDDGSGTKLGTKSYAERIASENKERAEDSKQGRDYFNSLNPEEKQRAYNYLKNNSQLDPRINPDARFSGFIDAYQNDYKTEPKMQYDDEGNPFLMMTDEQRDYQAGLIQDESPFVSALGEQPSFKSEANPTGKSRFNQSRFGGFDAIDSFGLNDKKDPYSLLEQQLFKDVNEEIDSRKNFNRY